VKGGHVVDTAALAALSGHVWNFEIEIAEGLHLVALTGDEYEPVMLFVNHSCEPNLGFREMWCWPRCATSPLARS